MPKWLCNQLRRAFLQKDRKQILLLNDCWFMYYSSARKKQQSSVQQERSGL